MTTFRDEIKDQNTLIKMKLDQIAIAHGKKSSYGNRPLIYDQAGSVVIKFSYQGKQITFVPGYRANKHSLIEIKSICLKIGQNLLAGNFSLGDLPSCKLSQSEVIEKNLYDLWFEFKSYFLKKKVNGKLSPDQLWQSYQGVKLDQLFNEKKNYYQKKYKFDRTDLDYFENTSLIFLRDVYHLKYDKTTKSKLKKLSLLKNFLQYANQDQNIFSQFTTIKKNTQQLKYCTDDQIVIASGIYQAKLADKSSRYYLSNLGYYDYFLILAIYGLRPHEYYLIKNWSVTCDYENNDYIASENGKILAITDSSNTNKLLAIGNAGKTGSRLVLPAIPNQLLIGDLYSRLLHYPMITDPLAYTASNVYKCSDSLNKNFKYNQLGFNPYQLRHSYAHRLDRLGVRPQIASQSMGHSLNVHNRSYLSSQNIEQLVADFNNELLTKIL